MPKARAKTRRHKVVGALETDEADVNTSRELRFERSHNAMWEVLVKQQFHAEGS